MQAARPEPRDPLTEDERSELERLRREVMKVRMEGDILKKAKAFSASDPQAACARNLLVQRFTASAPNRIWTAAITALPTAEGWLYLAVILDLYSRRVIGWATRVNAISGCCSRWERAAA